MSVLRKKIIDPRPAVFGLDLSDLSVKVMQIKDHYGRYEVKGYATTHLPPGCISDGVIKNRAVVLEHIEKARKLAGISTKNVICSLPETKAFLRIISIPGMTQAEAKEAIKWEIENHIPMTLEQVYYDWQILEPHIVPTKSSQMNVLVVAVARSVVDEWAQLLGEAGLEVYGFDIESVAQSRSLLRQVSSDTTKDETTMIVDIGDRRTSFLIAVDGAPVFTSSIPLSSESMTEAIAKALNLSHEEADKIKIEHGIGSVVQNDHIFSALKPVLENFIVEIERSIDFYVSGLKYSKKVDHIILCGGGSKTKGIIPYFSRRLQHDIVLGDPWINTPLKTLPPITRENVVQYSTVIGLASKSI